MISVSLVWVEDEIKISGERTAGNLNSPVDDRVIVTMMADVRRPENQRETLTKIKSLTCPQMAVVCF